MFSTIIVNDSKPNEKPECLQGDMALVITAKKSRAELRNCNSDKSVKRSRNGNGDVRKHWNSCEACN